MLRREVCGFLVVGFTTVAIDYAVYQSLVSSSSLSYSVSKGLGFTAGTVFAYVANRFWTFRHTDSRGNFFLFSVLYVFSLLVNVSVNRILLDSFGERSFGIFGAFVVATGISAVLNFLGMKFFVFKAEV